ncbi:MAG: diaminohydroxyphosphoribosylaminopyrimidine deaminase [Campylobacterota bacterium]|nr:diaminohydroxyphosphoribosylaminopyrimidine deaminase [Campylobacterota bacterium]
MDLDALYMQFALDEAWKYQGLTYPNPAVGAVITAGDKVIAIAAHQKAGTSHAEVLALLCAYENISQTSLEIDPLDAHKAHAFLLSLPSGFFSRCTIYVTLEPCSHEGKTPSCASLLCALNLQRIVVATNDPIQEHSGGLHQLKNVCFGVLQKEAEALLEPFVIWQKRAFVLFKIAQTSNGKIGGGYLSSKTSLRHVHYLRSVCSRLLIGGNTVRTDRPTLDCRFIEKRAPDVMVYSKEDCFDRTIPLFGVPDREVKIGSDLHFLNQPSFVLVEGGEGMLLALKEKIDWVLTYQTPKLSANNLTYNIDMNLSFLHQAKKDVDLIIWSKRID